MKIIRAIGLGILLWLFIFIWWMVMIMVWGPDANNLVKWMIHFILLIPVGILCARLYFKRQKPSLGKGFVLGIIFLIVGFILDLVITVPFFTGFFIYYSNLLLWMGFVELLLITSVVGVVSR